MIDANYSYDSVIHCFERLCYLRSRLRLFHDTSLSNVSLKGFPPCWVYYSASKASYYVFERAFGPLEEELELRSYTMRVKPGVCGNGCGWKLPSGREHPQSDGHNRPPCEALSWSSIQNKNPNACTTPISLLDRMAGNVRNRLSSVTKSNSRFRNTII